MNTSFKIAGIMAVSLMLLSGPALAEMVQGQVMNVNQENQTLQIQRMTGAGQMENIEVSVPEQASFRGGISSLDEIEVGDQIRAEANKGTLGFGGWEATWVESTSGQVATGQTGAPENLRQPGAQAGAGQTGEQASARQSGVQADAGQRSAQADAGQSEGSSFQQGQSESGQQGQSRIF